MTGILDSICYDSLLTIVTYFLLIFLFYIIIRIGYNLFNNIETSSKSKDQTNKNK